VPFRRCAARLSLRCTVWSRPCWVGACRVALVGLLATTFAGCGVRTGPAHLAADASVSNLGWDLNVANDDLLVARLDLRAQQRRLLLAAADLGIVSGGPAALVCSAAADVSGDVRSSRDGVVALRNDTARVKGSLKVVGVDLLRLHEQLQGPGLSAATKNQLSDAHARASRTMLRYDAIARELMADAQRLLGRTAGVGGFATRRCAQATMVPGSR
jgi:hypothetical protein